MKNLFDTLLQLTARCQTHLEINDENKLKQEALKGEISRARKQREELTKRRETMFSTRKAAQNYLADRKSSSIADIEAAVAAAGEVISGIAEGIHLKIDVGSAYIADKENIDISDAEGAAYSAIVSILFRDSVLVNTPYIPTFCWDEPFATLSSESSVAMSNIVSSIGESQQVILIEQKPETFVAGVAMTVTFVKVDWESEVKVECSFSEEQ